RGARARPRRQCALIVLARRRRQRGARRAGRVRERADRCHPRRLSSGRRGHGAADRADRPRPRQSCQASCRRAGALYRLACQGGARAYVCAGKLWAERRRLALRSARDVSGTTSPGATAGLHAWRVKGGKNMANPILVTGAAGRVGAIGRTVTQLLLKEGKAVRAMVRNEDERAQGLRDMGAEVVVGDLLDLDSMHRVIAGCETMYFGMS